MTKEAMLTWPSLADLGNVIPWPTAEVELFVAAFMVSYKGKLSDIGFLWPSAKVRGLNPWYRDNSYKL